MLDLEKPITSNVPGNGIMVIRRPTLMDGRFIHQLVRESGVLDVNSVYLYLLLCKDFANTCRVAEQDGELVGCVTAYIPPNQPQELFIWQVAVAPSHRGQGLALRLLMDLLAGLPKSQAYIIEATITPSNIASEKLFRALARKLDCELRIDDGFQEDLFIPEAHEPERMFYIGPVVTDAISNLLPEEHT